MNDQEQIREKIKASFGEEAYRKLVKRFSGQDVTIPIQPFSRPYSQVSTVVRLLGRPRGRSFVRTFAGMKICFRVERVGMDIEERDKAIVQEKIYGMSTQKIAKKYKLGERWVRKIVSRETQRFRMEAKG